ncbi:ead/Ea22-like family protein, partial [Salmonella enterica]
MTALNKQALRSKARSASAGEWIKESGDGWEAICSTNDQANGNFIIAHFEGPDALANREFVQAANPATVLALLDEMEATNELVELQRFKLERQADDLHQAKSLESIHREKRLE